MDNPIFYLAVGFSAMGALAVVLSKKMATMVFCLFAMVMGLALIYMSLAMPMALIAQIILYGGAMMVFVLFALFLYGENHHPSQWIKRRMNLFKGFLLLSVYIFLLFQMPWTPLLQWMENPGEPKANQPLPIKETGQAIASGFLLEFEMVGMLLLAAMMVAGWFVYSPSKSVKP